MFYIYKILVSFRQQNSLLRRGKMDQLEQVHQKIATFESSMPSALLEKSNCKKGCSRCCYVDLSVFQVEADYIVNWFNKLDSIDKKQLIHKWQTEKQHKQLNFNQELTEACVFLKQEECTIYKARPLICRTQGLALNFEIDKQAFVDICPLNENMLQEISPKQILNLDLINMILASLQSETYPQLNETNSRMSLRELQERLINNHMEN
jgi:Fe-S-cluster containining protein